MPRNYKSKSSNEQQASKAKKSKDKPTYKIIVLGSGGVGKVSLIHQIINLIFFSKPKQSLSYPGIFPDKERRGHPCPYAG
jgi:predicted GTPase